MKQYLEQRIPFVSPIPKAKRIAWLKNRRAKFQPAGSAWAEGYVKGLVTRLWRERRKERA